MTSLRPGHIDLESIIRQAPNVVERPLADGVAVLQPESGQLFNFDPIAADIWRRFAVPRPIHSVCRALLDEYDVEPEACRRQVLTLVRQWAVAGLVTSPSAGALSTTRQGWWARLVRRLRGRP